MAMETPGEQSARHTDEAISIAVVSQQIFGLKELVLEKLSKQDLVMGSIEEQTKKTNGSVALAFTKISAINDWKNKVIGGLIISNIIIIPILLYLIYLHIKP